MTDESIRGMAKTGGVMGVNFISFTRNFGHQPALLGGRALRSLGRTDTPPKHGQIPAFDGGPEQSEDHTIFEGRQRKPRQACPGDEIPYPSHVSTTEPVDLFPRSHAGELFMATFATQANCVSRAHQDSLFLAPR